MKTTCVIRFAGTLVFAGVLHVSAAAAVTDTVLHAFNGGRGGSRPSSGLININGTLYGTTESGGANCANDGGCGTVFSLDPTTHKETVLYSFKGGSDGNLPITNLIDVNGTLYGTTVDGGGTGCDESGCGTVFSLDLATHKEAVLHAFKGGSDGSAPAPGLININGTLYGTTSHGGGTGCDTFGCGTVFSLDPTTHKETVLYAFKGGSDGAYPNAVLIGINGNVYGTTDEGGDNSCDVGCGTVFSLDLATHKETVLYAFMGGSDGTYPNSVLTGIHGNVYGTTSVGGSGSCATEGGSGCGTVFSLDLTTRKETVLYPFKGGSDGEFPFAGLIDDGGTLYGTTVNGGGTGCNGSGCGTVFSIKP